MKKESKEFKKAQSDFIEYAFGVMPYPDITHIPAGETESFAVKVDYQVNVKSASPENDFSYEVLIDKKSGSVIADNNPEKFLKKHSVLISEAYGNVLVFGLGLGDSLHALVEMLDNGYIDEITVVERESDIIDLVAPSFEDYIGNGLHIVSGDAFNIDIPSGHYNMAYYALWSEKPPQDEVDFFLNLHRGKFDKQIFIFD